MIIKGKLMKRKILLQLWKKGDSLYFVTLFLFTLSCSTKGNYYSDIDNLSLIDDTIEVVYSPVLMETPIGFGCHYLKAYDFQKADTVYLDRRVFGEIASCLKRFTKISKHEDCDARFYIKYGKIDIFLQENPSYSCENEKTPFFKNKHALYLLLDKCLFYNHIPPKELKWNSLIKQFGIPDDYKYTPLYDPNITTYYYWRKDNGNGGFLKTVLTIKIGELDKDTLSLHLQK